MRHSSMVTNTYRVVTGCPRKMQQRVTARIQLSSRGCRGDWNPNEEKQMALAVNA